jgi:dihydroneopterin aldolase
VLDVDLTAARRTDTLAETVDYDALHGAIVEIVATTSYDLLERIGQEVLDRIFRDPRVTRAEVSIGKPRLLAGATPVVTLRQTR